MHPDANTGNTQPATPLQINSVLLRLKLEASIETLRPAIRDTSKRPVERALAYGMTVGHLDALYLAGLIDKTERVRRRDELAKDIDLGRQGGCE